MKISEKQSQHNAGTREQWEYFASHRGQTTSHICDARDALPASTTEPTLAILGAGNGNDIDLRTIAKSFSKIHLFDFDPVARGVAEVLPGRQFDVVVSTSLTSQLLASVVESFGDQSPIKNFMMLAIRDGHLQLMEKLIRSGGVGVLVCDFVSSDTLPELASADTEESILAAARKAIDERNFFTGTNPWAIKEALSKLIVEDPSRPVSIAPPWRWRIGESRFYAVTSIGFSKPG